MSHSAGLGIKCVPKSSFKSDGLCVRRLFNGGDRKNVQETTVETGLAGNGSLGRYSRTSLRFLVIRFPGNCD